MRITGNSDPEEKKMRFKAVVFDLDGVIVDTETTFIRVMEDFLVRMGLPHGPAETYKYLGVPSKVISEKIRADLEATGRFEGVNTEELTTQLYVDIEQKSDIAAMPGVQEFYDKLRRNGVIVALGTSREYDNAMNMVRKGGLKMDFDVSVTSTEITRPKPDPATFLTAAEKLAEYGIAKSEIMVLEDSYNGIRSARDAGLFVVGFKGSEVLQDTSEADVELYSFKEVDDLMFGQ